MIGPEVISVVLGPTVKFIGFGAVMLLGFSIMRGIGR